MSDQVEIPKGLTQERIQRALRESLKKPDLVVDDVQFSAGSAKGDNFTSTMFAADVKVKQGQVYNLIIKYMPQNEVRMRMNNDMNMFYKEAKIYTVLVPGLLKFQEDRNVEQLIIPAFPKCYIADVNQSMDDWIVMENLKKQGYKMADKVKGLDFKHSAIVLTELGKYHALSFAVKGSGINLKETYPFALESLFQKNASKDMRTFLDLVLDPILEIINKCDEYKHFVPKLEKIKEKGIFNLLTEMVNPDDSMAIINHGDCWTNNMMFKYEKAPDGNLQPVETKLVDLQIARIGSPCLDLSYFVFTSMNSKTRDKHLEELLKLYYDTCIETLQKLNSPKPNYSFEMLLKEFDEYFIFGFLMACMVLPVIMADHSKTKELNDLKESDMKEDKIKEVQKMFMGDPTKNIALQERLFGLFDYAALKNAL